MKRLSLPLLGISFAVLTARAVYAPIPEQEQGKVLSASVTASVYHDSNLFAARTGPVSTWVEELGPQLDLNWSATDQTFVSGRYAVTLDHFDDRPGSKDIVSHELDARLAHEFQPGTTLDLNDGYQIERNPASLLAGVPVNTDQSYKRNQLDTRFTTGLGDLTSVTLKAQLVNYAYDNAALASSIDRDENLFGLEVARDLRPELKLTGEYRYQTISYDTAGATKDKQSNFFLAGLNYAAAQKLTLTVRAGLEDRHRDGEPGVTAPSAELSAKYDYASRSYLTAGYAFDYEETSNVALYNDTRVNRFFVNVQQALGGSLAASGSLDFEPSQLQGRPGVSPDRDETTWRLGLALTWLGAKNWSVSGTYDYDRVNSDDTSREYQRNRFGVSARYSF